MDLTRHPLIDFERRLVDVAADRGFGLTHLVKYYCELSHAESHVTAYLHRPRALRNVIGLVVHPETNPASFHGVRGVAVKPDLWHGSNMRRFPKRQNKGVAPITYGHMVECADVGAFQRLLHALGSDGEG
jgi:hypothetical protein